MRNPKSFLTLDLHINFATATWTRFPWPYSAVQTVYHSLRTFPFCILFHVRPPREGNGIEFFITFRRQRLPKPSTTLSGREWKWISRKQHDERCSVWCIADAMCIVCRRKMDSQAIRENRCEWSFFLQLFKSLPVGLVLSGVCFENLAWNNLELMFFFLLSFSGTSKGLEYFRILTRILKTVRAKIEFLLLHSKLFP